MRLLIFITWTLFLLSDTACHESDPPAREVQVNPFVAAPAMATPISFAEDSLPAEVEMAHQAAICTLDRLISMYESVVIRNEHPIDAWNQHADLTRFMGRLSETDSLVPKEFLTLLVQIHDRMENRGVTYQMEDEFLGRCKLKKTRAYVRMNEEPPTIYLCPAWLEQTPGHRIATLVHETVHTLGFEHPHGTDTPNEALELAKNYPMEARQSPENFESLVEMYVCSH